MSGMADADLRVELSKLEGRVTNVESYIADDKERWENNSRTHEKLYQRTERPSWTVTTVISVLASLAAALGVWALTN